MAERSRGRKSPDHNSVRVNRTMPAHTTITHQGFEIPALTVPKPFQSFVNFVREQGVVGLGVGFVIGTSANTLIKSIVTNLINPLIGWATGGINLSQKTLCLSNAAGVCKDTINYGQIVSDIITFIVIILVVYFVIKGLRLDRLDKPKSSK